MALQVMSSYSINNKYSIQQAQVFPVGHLRLIRFMATISGTAYEYLNWYLLDGVKTDSKPDGVFPELGSVDTQFSFQYQTCTPAALWFELRRNRMDYLLMRSHSLSTNYHNSFHLREDPSW